MIYLRLFSFFVGSYITINAIRSIRKRRKLGIIDLVFMIIGAFFLIATFIMKPA